MPYINHSAGPGPPNHTLRAIIKRLPVELLVLVVNCLLQEDVYLKAADEAEGEDSTHKKPRYTVSRLSLVCQDWYIKLRPRLFKRLVLLSKTDLDFLLAMLRRHRHGWLSNTVAYVEVVVSDSGKAPPSIDRLSRQLSSNLPSLTELHFVLNDPSSSTRTITTTRNLPVLTITSASQPSLSQFTRMRCLVLRGVHVRTFSILAHALGGMTSLETVDFDEVSWTIKGSDDRMPTRLGAFGKLHTVKAHNMAAPWTLMWLFAPMFQRHCIHPDDQRPAPTNPDARLAILLTKTLLRHLDYASYRKSLVMEYYTGRDELLVALVSSRELPKLAFHLSSFNCSAPDVTCSVLRRVSVEWRNEDDLSSLGERWWSGVDSSFARDATNLESLDMVTNFIPLESADSFATLPPRFPCLLALGKFNLKRTLPNSSHNIPVRRNAFHEATHPQLAERIEQIMERLDRRSLHPENVHPH